MPAESLESLNQKLLVTFGSLLQLERLRRRGLPVVCRVLDKTCAALPLGMIPISLVWTAVVFFLPLGEPMTLIRLYAIGLLLMLVGTGTLALLRLLVSSLHLRDEILGELAQLPALAYHPNLVLRRAISTGGFATFGQFRLWCDKQRDILETRVTDFESAIAAAKRDPQLRENFDKFPAGARAFLES